MNQLKKSEQTINWYDKNKFNEILTTIESNKFNHKSKVSKFKFNDINDLMNNIKNNAISEAPTKKNKGMKQNKKCRNKRQTTY